MPWQRIIDLPECVPVSERHGWPDFYLLKNSDGTNWLIGQYNNLTTFATDLRYNQTSRDLLHANRIRIGIRSTDCPPANVDRQKRYNATIRGGNHQKNFTASRARQTAHAVKNTESLNRLTDREQNVKTFWDTQTPQSHHIVEFNNLETLGVSRLKGKRGMDYHQLPAVLLAAEFHQRYISAILKPTHYWAHAETKAGIEAMYSSLYQNRSQLFHPLWSVSKVILERAEIKINHD